MRCEQGLRLRRERRLAAREKDGQHRQQQEQRDARSSLHEPLVGAAPPWRVCAKMVVTKVPVDLGRWHGDMLANTVKVLPEWRRII